MKNNALLATSVAFILAATYSAFALAASGDTPLLDKSIPELRADMDAHKTSSVELVRAYLDRIERLDRAGPKVHSVLIVNPDALKQAAELDRELREKGPRGPLHGIPVLLKDNIETLDRMPTTAGSLALANNISGRDAVVAANLRAAGALILGKTNLSEWANYRSTSSQSGWSGIGGLTKNPHVLDRSPCGSSAGTGAAIASQFAAAGVGTETNGSITCPASMNGLVGVKPTAGLLSQSGIVPISHSQDTAGPMTRSVTDAAVLLTAMTSACSGSDPCHKVNYAASLPKATLQGKRVGVLRIRDMDPQLDAQYKRALQILKDSGATLIEAELPDIAPVSAAQQTVLLTEFKADLNAYLASTPPQVASRTLAQLIEFNNSNSRETVLFGQELFTRANATAGLDDATYKKALADSKRLAGAEGLARLLEKDRLDFIVSPTNAPAFRVDTVGGGRFGYSASTFPAVSGYPHVTLPMGVLRDLPFGISFIGAPWSEELLLGAAYAYEQKSRAIVKPKFKPTLEGDDPALQPIASH